MTVYQVIFAIYNYLFNEEARLEMRASESFKTLSSGSSTEHIEQHLKDRLRLELFREFTKKIYEILRYYESD